LCELNARLAIEGGGHIGARLKCTHDRDRDGYDQERGE